MKKFFYLIVSIVVIIGLLVGCGKKEDVNNEKNDKKNNDVLAEKQDAEINYDDMLKYIGKSEEELFEDLGQGEPFDDPTYMAGITYNYEGYSLFFYLDYVDEKEEKSVNSVGIDISDYNIDSKVSLNGIYLGMSKDELEKVTEGLYKYSDDEFEYEHVDNLNGYNLTYGFALNEDKVGYVRFATWLDDIDDTENFDQLEKEEQQEKKSSKKNDWTKGFSYSVTNDSGTSSLWITYKNTGDKVQLAKTKRGEDWSEEISTIKNVNESYNDSKLYFETIGEGSYKTVHEVDLKTLKEKFVTDGSFIRNVGVSPYTNSIIVERYNVEDSDEGSYYVFDSKGKMICELGDRIEDDVADQISIMEERINSCASENIKLDGFENEKYNDFVIDFSEYSTVVLPAYEGINNLENVNIEDPACETEDYSTVNFAVFGEISNLVITSKNINEETYKYEKDTMFDSIVNYSTPLSSDMCYVVVEFDVYQGEGIYEPCWFTLDDMKEHSEYEAIIY